MDTKFKHNQIVKVKKSFFRGSIVRLVDVKVVNNINVYDCEVLIKVGDKLIPVTPRRLKTFSEDELIKSIKIFGVWI